MHLTGQKSLFLAVVFAFACTDSSGPGAVTARFELNDINGRPLPTYPAATPGLTPTILSSTLIFDQTGQATITEHRTEWNGIDATVVTKYTYRISDNEILFSYLIPCPPNANCIAPPKGTFLLNRLSLEMGHLDSLVILYNYRLNPAQ